VEKKKDISVNGKKTGKKRKKNLVAVREVGGKQGQIEGHKSCRKKARGPVTPKNHVPICTGKKEEK